MSKRTRLVLSLVLLFVLAWSSLPQLARADELAPATETAGGVSYTPPSNPRFYLELVDENGKYIRDDDYNIIHIEPTWTRFPL